MDSALIAIRVGAVRRVMCASPAYLARKGVPGRPEHLADHDGISFRVSPWPLSGAIAATVRPAHVEPKPRLAVNTTEAAIQAAVAGFGIIRVLSYQVTDELRTGRLQTLLLTSRRSRCR